MKQKQFFLSLCLIVLAVNLLFVQSCTNEALDEIGEQVQNAEKVEFDIVDIRFENGMMVFDDIHQLNFAATELERLGLQKLEEFRNEHGFMSLKEKIDNEYVSAFEQGQSGFNKEFFYKDESGFLLNGFPFYFLASVLNENGVVKIGDMYHIYTKDFVYSFEKRTDFERVDFQGIEKTDAELGVYVSKVTFYSDPDSFSSSNAGDDSEIHSRELCDNYESGTLSEAAEQCFYPGQRAGFTIRVNPRSTAWSQYLSPNYNMYCARSWATVNSYNTTGPGTSTYANSQCSVSGYYHLLYWAGEEEQVVSGLINETSPNYYHSHTFTFWETSGSVTGSNQCYSVGNCYSYGILPVGTSTFGLNSMDGANQTPSEIDVFASSSSGGGSTGYPGLPTINCQINF